MRYLHRYLQADLEKKMVFLGGPRQTGKTTLAKSLLEQAKSGRYFNWDRDRDRKALLKEEWSDDEKLLLFDEIHKYKRWKNWIKGIFDTERDRHQFLVTGSARLDVYRRGGDSLLGRYHYWRLHPFTLSELPKGIPFKEGLRRLMNVGGFPEPFLDGAEREARRWREERQACVLRDDVRDLEPIQSIQNLNLLLDLLKERVGSPVVANNLSKDIGVSPASIVRWIDILERMYLVFRVRPYTQNIARAIQKPPKIFFFDNGDVLGDEGARFENLVACHLLKRIHFLSDRDGHRYELQYIRDKGKLRVESAEESRYLNLLD